MTKMFLKKLVYSLIWVTIGSSGLAQWDFVDRYRDDVSVAQVRAGELVRLGRLVDGTLYLSEREAVEMALANNVDINVERHTQLTRRWAIQQEQAFYDPVGTFGFQWDRDKTPTASVLQGGDSVTNILTNYNFGYQQPFSTGSTFQVTFQGTRNRSTNFFQSLVPAIDTQFDIQFRQNLLQGFGTTPAEYQIEISRNNLDRSEQEFRRIATDVIAQVQEQFWELEFAVKDIEVKEKSLELARTILDQNQARFEVGTASRLEVVEAEAEVASRREELITSQFTYRRVQDNLVKLITDLDDPRSLGYEILPEQRPPDADQPVKPFDQLLAQAKELRPELQESDLTIANRMVELEQTRDNLKPSLEFVAGYQQYGLGGRQVIRDFSQGFTDPQIIEIVPGGVGDALGEVFGAQFYGYLVGFNFELPIENEAARTQNAQSLINLNRAEMEKRSVQQSIGLEIRDALTQLEMNRARLEASRVAVRAARERLDGEQARFDVGVGTTRQLIEAQRDLLEAESLVVRANTNLTQSYKRLDVVVGLTFRNYNIVVQEAMQTNLRSFQP